MSLRVIAGSARGRRLKSVPGDTTRPVMDRVKEALFNILAGDVVDSNWWDLFAGTGAVGIEAQLDGAPAVPQDEPPLEVQDRAHRSDLLDCRLDRSALFHAREPRVSSLGRAEGD